jgi:hypothetical protein
MEINGTDRVTIDPRTFHAQSRVIGEGESVEGAIQEVWSKGAALRLISVGAYRALAELTAVTPAQIAEVTRTLRDAIEVRFVGHRPVRHLVAVVQNAHEVFERDVESWTRISALASVAGVSLVLVGELRDLVSLVPQVGGLNGVVQFRTTSEAGKGLTE